MIIIFNGSINTPSVNTNYMLSHSKEMDHRIFIRFVLTETIVVEAFFEREIERDNAWNSITEALNNNLPTFEISIL